MRCYKKKSKLETVQLRDKMNLSVGAWLQNKKWNESSLTKLTTALIVFDIINYILQTLKFKRIWSIQSVTQDRTYSSYVLDVLVNCSLDLCAQICIYKHLTTHSYIFKNKILSFKRLKLSKLPLKTRKAQIKYFLIYC